MRQNAAGNPDLILFNVTLNPDALNLLAQEIERAIDRPEITTRIVKDKILVEGRVYSESEQERAMTIAATYSEDRTIPAIEVVEEGTRYETAKQVHLDIKVMNIFNEDLSRLGIRWPMQIGNNDPEDGSVQFELSDTSSSDERLQGQNFSNVQVGELYYRFFGTITNLIPTLNLLVQDGGGTIVGNPRLVVKDGQTAKETVAGGEFPVVTGSAISGFQVTYKDFGFVVQATPRVNQDDDVDLNVSVESLQLVGQVTEFDLPLFSKDSIETRVNIPKGDSLVVAGVISNNLRQQWQRLPALGRIPLLNYLFGAKETTLEQTQTVIFLTPSVVDPGRSSSQDETLMEDIQLQIDAEPKFSRSVSGE